MKFLVFAMHLFYALAIGLAVVGLVAIIRVDRFRTYTAAFLVSVACLLGGGWVAIAASPDWSPLTMLAMYVPFLVTGIGAAIVARRFSSARR